MQNRDKSKQELIEEKKAEEALRESEHRYRLLSEAIPQMLWRADTARQTIECNRRWYEYTGQTPDEAQVGLDQGSAPPGRGSGHRASVGRLGGRRAL